MSFWGVRGRDGGRSGDPNEMLSSSKTGLVEDTCKSEVLSGRCDTGVNDCPKDAAALAFEVPA